MVSDAGGDESTSRIVVWNMLSAADIMRLRQLPTIVHARRALEVGTLLGGSAECILGGLGREGWLVCVDRWEMPEDDPCAMYYAAGDVWAGFRLMADNTGLSTRIIPIRGDSALVLPLLPDRWFELVFLDGDHHDAPFRADLAEGMRLVRAGGLLAGHDYGSDDHPALAAIVDEVLGKANPALIKGTVWSYLKTADGRWVQI